jgi:hypothetical protein
MVIDPQGDRPMATIWMNRVQPSLAGGSPVFQTWNPIVEPEAARVYTRASFQRPVVNARALEGARIVDELHAEPGRRLWCSGSYLGPGIPLLESATATAAKVVSQIDGTV